MRACNDPKYSSQSNKRSLQISVALGYSWQKIGLITCILKKCAPQTKNENNFYDKIYLVSYLVLAIRDRFILAMAQKSGTIQPLNQVITVVISA